MDKNSNTYTLGFAAALCFVLAVCLAATYNGLKARMDENARLDKQRNVLLAMGLVDPAAPLSGDELARLYEERVERQVLEVKREQVTEEVMRGGERLQESVQRVVELVPVEAEADALDAMASTSAKLPKAEREHVELFRGRDDSGNTIYCIPIEGYGLWSTLYGFLALEQDLDTVRGITFYAHKETPGLGGEVDNLAWQRSWRGKKILDERGNLRSVTVKKGVVDANIAAEQRHMVDGLSGATITSNGVTNFVAADLQTYQPYFKKLRS